MKRTDIIRSLYREMNDFTLFVYQNSTADKIELQKALQEYVRRYRDRIRASYRPDPLAKPLTEEARFHYDDDGEGCTEYRIFPEDGYTSDEEVEEYIHDYIELPPICSPYDCTGKRFTRWVSWKRTPAGIAVIHRIGLDV